MPFDLHLVHTAPAITHVKHSSLYLDAQLYLGQQIEL